MRHAPRRLMTLASSLALVAAVLPACKGSGPDDEPSKGAVMAARSPIASYRSKLEQIQPRVNATIDSANAMLSKATTDPKGAVSAFTGNVERLKGDVMAMREEVDELQRIGFDQYFLGQDRTTAVTSDPAVTEARTKYGYVGDYMVALRDKGAQTLGDLESISRAVNANPTAAGIRSQADAIGRLAPARIEIDSLIGQLTKAIDAMPRR